MKTRFTFLMLLLISCIAAYPQDSWLQKADFGGVTRTGAAGFSIAGKGYIGTGFSNYEWLKDFWEYDAVNDVWTQKADFAGIAREGGVGFSIGNKGYIGTGENGDEWPFTFNDFWEYDVAANTWTRKTDLPGGSRGRYTAVGFTIGSKGYVGLGSYFGVYDSFCWSDFWEYDPAANVWTKKADFAGGKRASAIAFAVDDKGYVGTGTFFEETDNGTIYTRYKDLWQFEPATNLWTSKADFPVGERFGAIGFSVVDKGYLSLGFDVVSGTTKKDLWEYSPLANTWLQRTDFPGIGTSRLVAFPINDKAYMGVGSNANDFWEYNPSAITDTCAAPTGLRVVKVTSNAALIKWNIPADTPSNYKIRYRAMNDTTTVTRKTKGSNNCIILTDLKPGTKFKWQMRSFCNFDTSAWINGPEFTTKLSSAITANIYSNMQTTGNTIKVMPNPSNGNFAVALQLPKDVLQVNLFLYDAAGKIIWQQKARATAGSANINIALAGKLSTGTYLLKADYNHSQMMQHIMVLE